jgi:replicative DNA helicase
MDLSESAVIGCLLQHNDSIVDIDITSEQFENSNHGMIFGTMKAMLVAREVVDIITLAERLMSDTGRDYLAMLSELATNGFSRGNVKAYCQSIKNRYQERLAKEVGQWLIDNSSEKGSVNESIKKLMAMGRQETKFEYGINEAMRIGIKAIQDAEKNKGRLIGIPTGLTELDDALGGFHAGDLVIIGARPAMGKTSVLLNMLMGAKDSVGIFSGEQGIGQIIQRLISIESKVSLMNMRNGQLSGQDYDRLSLGGHRIKQHPGVRFFDKPNPSIDEIESNARRWKFEYNIKALYVDYLQKIKRDPRKNKIEAIGDNVSRLKDLARELEIPIVCLAQVKRDVETRPDRKPKMGDLSDSSEIEKEADQIIMLYRDEVYNPETQYPGIMELTIEKNRHGATGGVRAAWDGRYLSVSDMKYGAQDD